MKRKSFKIGKKESQLNEYIDIGDHGFLSAEKSKMEQYL
jgi:hypothetical protein